jgi:hypothetical protein
MRRAFDVMRRAGVLLVVFCLLSGCRWQSDGRDHNPDNQPAYARPTRTTEAPRHVVHGPAVRTGQALLQVVNGADVVRVRVADLGDRLFEISTPEDSKAVPAADVTDSSVIVGLRDTGRPGPAVVTAVLNNDVRWTVRLSGGAGDELVDLTGGPGGDVDLAAGTSRAEVALPAAHGTQRVSMTGGAGQLLVRLTGNAPARVAATGGAGAVTIDGQRRTGIPGGWMWTPDTWATATDRYDINASAGVSTLTVTRSS